MLPLVANRYMPPPLQWSVSDVPDPIKISVLPSPSTSALLADELIGRTVGWGQLGV